MGFACKFTLSPLSLAEQNPISGMIRIVMPAFAGRSQEHFSVGFKARTVERISESIEIPIGMSLRS
jgi:hypothetical protein